MGLHAVVCKSSIPEDVSLQGMVLATESATRFRDRELVCRGRSDG